MHDQGTPFTVRVELLDSTALGVRRTRSALSNIRVAAGPFEALDRTLAAAGRPEHMTYILSASALSYIGRGGSDRRIGDRLAKDDLGRIEQVFLVYTADPSFAHHFAKILEHQLWGLGEQNGVPLANKVAPNGVTADELKDPEARHLLRDARLLLNSAGCGIFEHRHTPTRQPVTSGALGIRVLEQNELPDIPDCLLFLNHKGLRARGFGHGSEFVVLPESEFLLEDQAGLDKNNRRRRKLVRDSGHYRRAGDHGRLPRPLLCKSLAIAAKIVTGQHITGHLWRPSPPAASPARSFGAVP